MDIRKIKTLIEMLEASNLNEIEVSQGEESVRISKSSGEIKVLQDSNIGINNEPQSINKIDNNQIENEMKVIVSKGDNINKSFKTKKEALSLFETRNEDYKIKIIDQSGQDSNFQIYQQGDSEFIDLCRGPHLPSLKFIGSFKLTKISGAYWKGDSKNEMLQRIYGTAWLSQKELEKHLNMIEEAKKKRSQKNWARLRSFSFSRKYSWVSFLASKGLGYIQNNNGIYQKKT